MRRTPSLPRFLARARLPAARGWAYLRTPALLVRKLTRVWRRSLMRSRYGQLLTAGQFLPRSESPVGDRLFTVALPVWRVAEGHLRAAIASVVNQSYGNWELIALDDASPEPHVARVLAEAARSDSRIRVLSRRTNAGIALASNEILAEARGEYVAFLDHDDELHPRALEFVGRHLSLHPATDWVFTDEDKLDERGRHLDPCLKPGWSRHLLLGFNYVSHLRTVRRAVLERVGGHRAGFDGAQDYDLALRTLAAGASFSHLPGILYHWRATPGSMAAAAIAKPHANERALAALLEHVEAFPRGGRSAGAVILSNASVFRARRRADPSLSCAVATTGEAWREPASAAPRSVHPMVVTGLSPSELVAAARSRGEDVIALPPPGGFTDEQLAELVAVLQVPGTAAVAGRLTARRHVSCSGWVVLEDGTPADPCAGLHVADPGYLNLAVLPGRRIAPPPFGWVAWRSTLIAAWDAAADAPEPWRLAAGWYRLGLEVVTTPDAGIRLRGPVPHPPASPPPPDLPRTPSSRLALIGALP